jgi:hypothetical protein
MLFKVLAIAMIGLIGITTSSVFYRLQKRKPIMKSDFPAPHFTEIWCSGRSDRNALARLPIAKNILWMIVTKEELHVSPHFPFSLMFLPEAFGLDHRVPGGTIMNVRETDSALLGRSVVVKYRHATGDEEYLELWVNDLPGLMRALAEIRERGGSPLSSDLR